MTIRIQKQLHLPRRRLLYLAGAAAVAPAALAGCLPGGATSAKNPPAGDDGVREIDFTSWSMNEEASIAMVGPLVKAAAEAAEADVKTPSFPYNDYLRQLILQIQGGQVSGAIQLDIAWLSNVGSLGKLADLSDASKGIDYADYALAASTYDGVQVGLPWTYGAIGLVANSEILGRAGITQHPVTIEEFDNALRAIKRLGNGIIPYAAMTKIANLKDIVVWMWTFGSPVIDDAGKVTLGDEGSVAALTWYKNLFDEGLIGADIERADARALMGQGRVGIYDDAPGARQVVSALSPGTKVIESLVPMARPVLKSGQPPQAMAWGQCLCLVKGGDGEHTGVKFIQALTGEPEITIKAFESAGLPPATKAALQHPDFLADKFAAAFASNITPTSKPDPIWRNTQSALMYDALAKQVQKLLAGEATPQDAANAARTELEGLKD